MELGEKIGEGAGSEAYAWGPGRIVKLFKDGVDPRLVDHEVHVTRAVFESGAPAPEVLDVVAIHGRRGIVLPRHDGATLLNMVRKGRISASACGEIMGKLHHELHAPRYQASLITFRTWATFYIRSLRTKRIAGDVLDIVERVLAHLPADGTLCHGDLHADNILMTSDGPKIIDWVSALNADPLVDVARQHLTFTILPAVAPHAGVRASAARREADAAFIQTYAVLSETTATALVQDIAPYVVVMAAMRMMESRSTPEEQRLLCDYIRSAGPPA